MNGLDLDKAWKEGTHIFKLHGYKTRARKIHTSFEIL